MKVVVKGTANRRDRVHATCSHCETNVMFWRDEPGTSTEYVGTYDEGVKFKVLWKCPVCGLYEKKYIFYIDPVYNGDIQGLEGIEKNRVLSPEEKADMESATAE